MGAPLDVEIPYDGGYFTVELRLKESWDWGIPAAAIVVREVHSDGLSYVPTYPAELAAGQHFRHPGRHVHVRVNGIDSVNRTASVTIDRDSYIPPPPGDDPIDRCEIKPWLCE